MMTGSARQKSCISENTAQSNIPGVQPIPDPAIFEAMSQIWNPLHFTTRIVPMLKDGGATEEQIDALLVDNPRRLFAGEKLHAVA